MVGSKPGGHGEVVLQAFSVPYDALHSENAFKIAQKEGEVAKGAKFDHFTGTFLLHVCFS